MPLQSYGILKGKAVDKIMASSSNEHFQILVNADGTSYRIAINVKSQVSPPEVLFYMDHDYHHEITDAIKAANLNAGYTHLQSAPGTLAVDFIRRNMFDIQELKPIPYNIPGADNDINEKLDFYVTQAINEADAVVYAWGDKWGPETAADQYFHFKPGNGIHDIHMNQGNDGSYKKDNGVWQDGALMIYFPSREQWVAVFIAFQVQTFHTDDQTGNPIAATPPGPGPIPVEQETPIRIIAAMVNPEGDDVGKESIILLNKSNQDIDLTGWSIVDKNVNHDTITAKTIPGADTLKITLTGRGAQLGNKGGTITLLNAEGLKIAGVSYTESDADVQDELVEF
jgi:uncharacterized protein YukJ